MTTIVLSLCLFGFGDTSSAKELLIARPAIEVRDEIGAYYDRKYPPSKAGSEDYPFRYWVERYDRAVEGKVSSDPHPTFYSFFEYTERSRTEVLVTKLDFQSEDGGKACRIVISTLRRTRMTTPCGPVRFQ